MIEPSWVARRVSVRRVVERRPDGRLMQGDVVGDLVALDEHSAVIESRDGLVEVPVALITIARLVPPSTADELGLERVAAAGWRAGEQVDLDGWTLRADHGFTQRANSVLPLRQLRMPLDDALSAARAWYAERGLPLVLQLPVEARRLLDAELGERGWEPSPDVAVLVMRLDRVADRAHLVGTPPASLDTAPDDARLTASLAATPDDAWLGIYRGGAGLDPSARALLTRHDDAVFVSLRQDGRVVAVGRGVVDEGWLGLSAVEVDPQYRRQGLAGNVMAVLTEWGRERGALRAYLQVSSDNLAALALYEQLGYWHHHDYRYRTDPS